MLSEEEDDTYCSLLPINCAGDDSAEESESVNGEDHDNKSGDGTERKGKEEPVKELIKKKSVPQVLKILRDRVNRRIKNDQFAGMKSYIWLLGFVIRYQISFLYRPMGQTLKQILSKWPARSDLDNVKMDIKVMEDKERLKAKQYKNADEMKMEALPGLEKIEEDIKKLDEERVKDSAITAKLAETFVAKDISLKTLENDFSKAFPWLFGESSATNEAAVDQFQGSLHSGKESGQESDSEDPDDKNRMTRRQRKRKAPKEKERGRSTKRRRGTEPKGKDVPVKELIKERSVLKVLKNLRDRVHRRIKNDRFSAMKYHIWLLGSVIQYDISFPSQPIGQTLKQILSKWPARSDLDNIMMDIKAMKDKERRKAKQFPNADEMKMEALPGLEKIEEDIKKLDKEREKDSEKTAKLAETFLTKGIGLETLEEEFSKAFPWLFGEASATNKAAVDQFQVSLQNGKGSGDKDIEDLEKELLNKDNCNVGFSNFPGLKYAKDSAEGNIPDYLKSIVNKIEDKRGEPTNDAYQNILLFVSAAVKEMGDVPVDELDKHILHKWAATYNLAKQMQFQVKFVENMLKKRIHAYLRFSKIKHCSTAENGFGN
ncbi:uncharacterized protein LOC108459599 isoform X1 [Gossypium arboreum]|uniref:Uncharacterized protein n=1 Tax=Gossypium arboreum TaxID=29729 RepID=A0ABR0QBB4_GOSAR|nr:uncharacterized protein LOC108459599 isoform X1 [Gossypium arboreum]KAK5836168.1 hypothetical protein PVK06_011924 [Gossypium arboreum]